MMKYKKISLSCLCLILIFLLTGCQNSQVENTTKNSESKSNTMPTVINTNEYVLYENIYYNNQADNYVGKNVTKKGTFTILQDEYSATTRYYVWGYNDQTKCCDWQWEFKIDDVSKLPAIGSLITVTGNFVANENALDGYWIENANVKIEKEYDSGYTCDVDLTTMGGTLERVQLQNVQQYADKFEDKKICVYGRVATPTSIQHPYYDNAFSQEFVTTDEIPAIGKMIIVSGTYKNGVITESIIKETNSY